MPILRAIELLKALMTEENLKTQNLISIFDDESTVIIILENKQEITAKQIQKFGYFSHISPKFFLALD